MKGLKKLLWIVIIDNWVQITVILPMNVYDFTVMVGELQLLIMILVERLFRVKMEFCLLISEVKLEAYVMMDLISIVRK